MPLKEEIMTCISQEKKILHVIQGPGGSLTVARRQKTGARRRPRPKPLWGFPWERQSKSFRMHSSGRLCGIGTVPGFWLWRWDDIGQGDVGLVSERRRRRWWGCGLGSAGLFMQARSRQAIHRLWELTCLGRTSLTWICL